MHEQHPVYQLTHQLSLLFSAGIAVADGTGAEFFINQPRLRGERVMKKISLMKKTRDILGQPFGPILALIGLMSVATFVLQRDALAQDNPSWTPTGSLNLPRSGHTATLLGNGKVLVVGGTSANSTIRCWSGASRRPNISVHSYAITERKGSW